MLGPDSKRRVAKTYGVLHRRWFLSGLAASSLPFLTACAGERGRLLGSSKRTDGPGRAALLAPISGPSARLGQIMRQAASLGGNVLDSGGELSLHDTGDTPEMAVAAARQAVAEGARMLVGPLFGAQARAVAEAVGRDVPIVTMSNDTTLAGTGAYVLGITPEQSAASVIGFAVRRGQSSIGIIVPPGEFGSRAAAAASSQGQALGAKIHGPVTGTEPAAAVAELRRIAGGALPGAVYLPSAGSELEGLARALGSSVQILGSAQWSGIDAGSIPALRGAWFAAPDPLAFEPFAVAYEEAYGTPAGVLGGLTFDGVEMARLLGRIAEQDRNGLLRKSGFNGVLGPYAFEKSGLCRRGLAVLNVGAGATTMIGAATS